MKDVLDQMRRNPRGDWSIDDVKTVCRQNGIGCEPPRSGGSHYKVFHEGVAEILTIPFKRPIKPVYIRRLVSFVEEARLSGGKT
jgi:hypothetical protein